jgi:hypothetical protein
VETTWEYPREDVEAWLKQVEYPKGEVNEISINQASTSSLGYSHVVSTNSFELDARASGASNAWINEISKSMVESTLRCVPRLLSLQF